MNKKEYIRLLEQASGMADTLNVLLDDISDRLATEEGIVKMDTTELSGDYEMDMLADVVGVVEATSFEKLCLWQRHVELHGERAWIEAPIGISVTVGHVGARPVCVHLSTVIVNGHKILFIDPTSAIVDYSMIDRWLTPKLPKSAYLPRGEFLNKHTAMNFYNVMPR